MSLDGAITKEAIVATDPEAIATCLSDDLGRLERVGVEAGPMSEWLVRGLADLGVSVVLMETRQVRAALSAMIAGRGRWSGTSRRTPWRFDAVFEIGCPAPIRPHHVTIAASITDRSMTPGHQAQPSHLTLTPNDRRCPDAVTPRPGSHAYPITSSERPRSCSTSLGNAGHRGPGQKTPTTGVD